MITQPKSIDRVRDGIRITWEDGRSDIYPAVFLRTKCPCAVCRETPGHPPPQPISPHPVAIVSAHPIGRYALQFVFSDGHDTGIFSFEYLRNLGPQASTPAK
jgi:DUF971 family protein